MMRWLCLVGLLIVSSVSTCLLADEPKDQPSAGPKAKAVAERRIDPEKLKRIRERLEKSNADNTNLKRMTWKVGETTREALVYIPPVNDTKEKHPLVFAFHGHGGRAEYSARKLPMHELWPNAICVYPQGLPTPVPVIDVEGKLPGWQKYEGDQDDRDLLFFDAMLQSFKADYTIDASRIFSTGHSNGGFFTYVLWAARGDTLTAVAPIAAFANPRDFDRQKPKPVLHIAGEADRIVPFAQQERTIKQVRKLNGCDAEGKATSKMVTKYTSKDGPPVVTYIHPGSHGIPDDAPKLIVEFFQSVGKK